MAVFLNIAEEEGYLHVTVTGENTPENVFSYLLQIRNACAQRHRPVVLIEENLAGAGLGVREVSDVVSLASENVDAAVERIAYVDVNPEHDPVRMKFAERVAADLGVNVRIFPNLEDARRWLRDCAAAPREGGGDNASQDGAGNT